MKINSSKNLSRIHKHDKWEFSSLTMRKEMIFSSVAKLEKVVKNLILLQKEKFNNIVIPDFTYEVDDGSNSPVVGNVILSNQTTGILVNTSTDSTFGDGLCSFREAIDVAHLSANVDSCTNNGDPSEPTRIYFAESDMLLQLSFHERE